MGLLPADFLFLEKVELSIWADFLPSEEPGEPVFGGGGCWRRRVEEEEEEEEEVGQCLCRSPSSHRFRFPGAICPSLFPAGARRVGPGPPDT
ncbi:unnamed protein product [Arctogadus glacialis]